MAATSAGGRLCPGGIGCPLRIRFAGFGSAGGKRRLTQPSRPSVLRHRSEGLGEVQHEVSVGVGRREHLCLPSDLRQDLFRDRSIAPEVVVARGVVAAEFLRDADHAAPEALGEVRRGAKAQLPAECFRQFGEDLVVRLKVGALLR